MNTIADLTDEVMYELAMDYRESSKPFSVWARGGTTLENEDFVPEEVLLSNGDAIQWFAHSKS